jgi:hypothetical protein
VNQLVVIPVEVIESGHTRRRQPRKRLIGRVDSVLEALGVLPRVDGKDLLRRLAGEVPMRNGVVRGIAKEAAGKDTENVVVVLRQAEVIGEVAGADLHVPVVA